MLIVALARANAYYDQPIGVKCMPFRLFCNSIVEKKLTVSFKTGIRLIHFLTPVIELWTRTAKFSELSQARWGDFLASGELCNLLASN